MILDTSALVAFLLRENEARQIKDAIDQADTCSVGAPSLVETWVVLRSRGGDETARLISTFLAGSMVQVIDFSSAHWPVAVDAYARYGKGRHPAGLNLGDCLTYAIAKIADEPLLFTGDDFRHTDLVSAL